MPKTEKVQKVEELKARIEASEALLAAGIPLTLLIDENGREIARKLGPAEWDNSQLMQSIRERIPNANGQGGEAKRNVR